MKPKYPYVAKGIEGSIVIVVRQNCARYLVPGLWKQNTFPGDYGFIDEQYFTPVSAVVVEIKGKHYLAHRTIR